MATFAIAELPSATIKTVLVARLRDAILSGVFKPGERLNESKLSREFNVSRIPIREALALLQEQGLVMNHPRRGMFVNSLTDEDVQKINSLRIILEAEALKLARARLTRQTEAHLSAIVERMESWGKGSQMDAASLDLEFHRALWHASGNSYLERTLDSLVPIVFAHQAIGFASQEMVRWRLNHHRFLLEVIQGSSKQSPEEAIMMHLRMGYTNPEGFSSFGMAGAAQAESSGVNALREHH